MKQTFAIVSLLILLVVIGLFFYTSNKKSVTVFSKTNVSLGLIQRMFSAKDKRAEWLPKEGKVISETEYILEDCTYNFISDNLQNNYVTVTYESKKTSSNLNVSNVDSSSIMYLNFEQEKSSNPFTIISNYFFNKHIQSTTGKLLIAFANFIEKSENVYGVSMKKVILKDSTLIAIKSITKGYPSVNEIYQQIQILQKYAVANDAKATNAPMLNIYKNGDTEFSFMVALPINKYLKSSGNILTKRMLAGGGILESGDVKGGFITVDNALKELENFKADNAFMSPAIPFQQLVTDRQKETDTSKWITKLYYPVF